MNKWINSNDKSYYIYCEERSDEYITIKDIQNSIKALKTLLDVEVVSIESAVNIDIDTKITDVDYLYFNFNKHYDYRDLIETEIVSNTKVKFLKGNKELILRVNKDESFTDINGKYITYIKNSIKRVKLTWE